MNSSGKIIGVLVLLGIAALVVAFLLVPEKPVETGNEGDRISAANHGNDSGSVSSVTTDPSTSRQSGDIAVEPIQRSNNSGRNVLSLRGRVVNETGNGVGGATVIAEQGVASLFSAIQGEQAKFSTSTKSDAEGNYQFEGLPPHENYVLSATHPEYASARHSYIPVAADQVTDAPHLVLDSGYTISGMVLDKDKNPVAGATVSADPTFLNPFTRPHKTEDYRSTKSDNAGAYRLTRLPQGQISLTAKAKGHGSRTMPNILLVPEKKAIEQEIVLEEAKSIEGKVVDASGRPISNAKIEATSYSSQNPSRGSAVSDGLGSFAIDDVASGTYVLVVNADNFTTKRENRVMPGEPVTVTLASQGSVMGKVTAKRTGKAVSSFSIEARKTLPNGKDYIRVGASPRSFQSADGSYQLSGLDQETSYVLLASAQGYATTVSAPITISGAAPIGGVDIALSSGGTIRGTIVDAKTQKPVRGATVITRDNQYIENPLTQMFGMSQEDSGQESVRSGMEGEFTIAHAAPGIVQIEIAANGYTSRFMKDLSVVEEQTTDLGTIALSTGGSISGSAFDGSGRPLSGAEVSLRSLSPGSLLSRNLLTDQAGRFTLRNLPPGDYSVAVSSGSLNAGNIFEKIKQINENKKSVTVREGEEIAGLTFVVN